MTAILLLAILALAIVVDLVATMRSLNHDKPAEVPRSHRDWADAGLPSHPYSSRA